MKIKVVDEKGNRISNRNGGSGVFHVINIKN
jgi:hypothetical protein